MEILERYGSFIIITFSPFITPTNVLLEKFLVYKQVHNIPIILEPPILVLGV